jgi:hypothetical protein
LLSVLVSVALPAAALAQEPARHGELSCCYDAPGRQEDAGAGRDVAADVVPGTALRCLSMLVTSMSLRTWFRVAIRAPAESKMR